MTIGAREGRRPSSRNRIRALGALTLLVIATSVLAFGGVLHESRALVHGLLTVGLLIAASLPDRALARAGGLVRVGVGFGALTLAVGVGLLPLPHGLLSLLAPLTADAHPDRAWWTLSILPERTVDELALFVMLLGVALLTGAWAALRRRRSTVEWALLVWCMVLVAVGGAHHLAGASRLFGMLPSGLAPGGFFAPFVDANHHGAALALGLPVVASLCAREPIGSGTWWLAALTAVSSVFLMVASGSRGAALGLVVAMCVLAWEGSRRQRLISGAVLLGAIVVVVSGSLRSSTGWSLDVRPLAWRAALEGLPGTWLAGSGGGTVFWMVDRHRLDDTGYVWGHLHNDPLEWMVETGLVGLLAFGVALWALAPRASRDPRSRPLTAGLVAVGVNSLVEFPLQIPGIALAAAALLVCRRILFDRAQGVAPGRVRAFLLVAALLQPLGAFWSHRAGLVDRARVDAMAWHDDAERGRDGARALRRLAPWRPEALLVEAWETAAAGRWDEAAELSRQIRRAHPHDPTALRAAATLVAAAGHPEEAGEILDRAEALAPRDWRTAVVRARLAPPDEAVERWRQALAYGAPPSILGEAYEALPVGLVWLDAMAHAPAWRQAALARMLDAHGETDVALLAWERARMLDGRDPPTLPHITALARAGRLDEALALSREALSRGGEDPMLLERVAQIHLERGEVDRAVEQFLRAGERRPGSRALAVRALASERGDRAALDLIRRLELTGTETASLRLELAAHYADVGDHARCVQQVDGAERRAAGRHQAALAAARERCGPAR